MDFEPRKPAMTPSDAFRAPRFGIIMLVLLVAITAIGLFENSRRSRLADWHQQQANACTQAAVEFEERAEGLMQAGQQADAESCLRSAIVFARNEEAHERMAQRLRQPFWQDWLPK